LPRDFLFGLLSLLISKHCKKKLKFLSYAVKIMVGVFLALKSIMIKFHGSKYCIHERKIILHQAHNH